MDEGEPEGKTFEDCEDHLINCGYGGNGRGGTQKQALGNEDLVGRDESEEALKGIRHEINYSGGEATKERGLEEAGVARARGLFAVLPRDSDNILLTLSSKDLNDDIRIVAKAESSESEKHLRRAGAEEVVLPDNEGGRKMARSYLHPEITSLYDQLMMGDVWRAGSIEVPENKALDGRTIQESGIREKTGASVIGIKRNDDLMTNPKVEQGIEAGDVLIVMGTLSQIEELRELASMEELPGEREEEEE